MKFDNVNSDPGVYIFKDEKKRVIYIGKAVNLKNRLSSYFQKSNLLPKTAVLVSQIKSFETIPVQSEIEALILEANLIKEHQPYFNQKLRDDKDYLYITVTQEDFPQIKTARKKDLKDSLTYFGPFPEGTQVRRLLKTVRKIFPYRTCQPYSQKACFYYHLGLCLGVCVGKVSSIEYKTMIKRFIKFMKGKKDQVKKSLEKEMKKEAKLLNFEKAALLKKQLHAIDYITAPITRVEEYVANPNLLEDLRLETLKEASKILKLDTVPRRIECYDISNLSGKFSSGSMIVFTDGAPDRGEYRRFRIKKVVGIDDYASLREVLKRRLNHDWPKPDLIVIDGGKGQLAAAVSVLKEQRQEIPALGLAKREEQIYLPDRKDPEEILRGNKALALIQQLRDEAHRFALKYHRHLRHKAFLTQ